MAQRKKQKLQKTQFGEKEEKFSSSHLQSLKQKQSSQQVFCSERVYASHSKHKSVFFGQKIFLNVKNQQMMKNTNISVKKVTLCS